MDIQEKLLGGVRDRKIIQLYQTLSRSDLKGNYEDTYTLEVTFALMCIDVIANTKMHLNLEPIEFITLAKNVVRCTDDGELSIYSFYNWSEALLKYMTENNLTPKKIDKLSVTVLIKDVKEYLTRDE